MSSVTVVTYVTLTILDFDLGYMETAIDYRVWLGGVIGGIAIRIE